MRGTHEVGSNPWISTTNGKSQAQGQDPGLRDPSTVSPAVATRTSQTHTDPFEPLSRSSGHVPAAQPHRQAKEKGHGQGHTGRRRWEQAMPLRL